MQQKKKENFKVNQFFVSKTKITPNQPNFIDGMVNYNWDMHHYSFVYEYLEVLFLSSLLCTLSQENYQINHGWKKLRKEDKVLFCRNKLNA